MNADSTRTKLFLADSRGRFVKRTFCLRAFLHETSVSLRGFLFWLLFFFFLKIFAFTVRHIEQGRGGGRDVFSGDIKALDAIYIFFRRRNYDFVHAARKIFVNRSPAVCRVDVCLA